MESSTEITLANAWDAAQTTASTATSAGSGSLPTTGDAMLDAALVLAAVAMFALSGILAALAHREGRKC